MRLQIGDIDADRCGCKCETPKAIETALSRCRRTPCDIAPFLADPPQPRIALPNRKCGLKKAHLATTPLDRGGIQTLRLVTRDCGLKYAHVCAIPATHLIEAGVDLLEVQKSSGINPSSPPSVTPTSDHTKDNAADRINALIGQISIGWNVHDPAGTLLTTMQPSLSRNMAIACSANWRR
ncbi:MAG: hypothetical protein IPP22_15210 [Nitrosomonas sp.]|nr:hypothetical protein [Nitrosomonas sp.]